MAPRGNAPRLRARLPADEVALVLRGSTTSRASFCSAFYLKRQPFRPGQVSVVCPSDGPALLEPERGLEALEIAVGIAEDHEAGRGRREDEVVGSAGAVHPTAFASAGDNVGYAGGPTSSALCQKLIERKIPSVFGNHEAWTGDGRRIFMVDDRGAPKQLSGEALAWCKKLPLRPRVTLLAPRACIEERP